MLRKQQTPEPLNAADLKTVTDGIYHVWGMLGYDFVSACEEAGETLSNEAAIEGCIDADRLKQYGKLDAQKLVSDACKAGGYGRLLKQLKKHVSLM